MKTFVVLLVALTGVNSVWAENEVQHTVRLTATGGSTFYSFIDQRVTSQNVALGSVETRSESKGQFGLEAMYRPNPLPFAVGLVGEWNKFGSEGADRSATELGFYLLPKAIKTVGSVDIWAGFGIGLMTFTPAVTSVTVDDYRLTVRDSSLSAFAISPRFGFDWFLSETFSIGLQGSFVRYSGTLRSDIIKISTSESAPLEQDITRTGWATAIRIGLSL